MPGESSKPVGGQRGSLELLVSTPKMINPPCVLANAEIVFSIRFGTSRLKSSRGPSAGGGFSVQNSSTSENSMSSICFCQRLKAQAPFEVNRMPLSVVDSVLHLRIQKKTEIGCCSTHQSD